MRHLIQADARHLPLADESVQMCVTSPPYWGLRAYAGEQREVWGGEPGHAHEWGSHLGGEGYAGSNRKRWQHGATRAEEPERWQKETDQGGSCECGAWYGALGLEPTPDLYVEHMVEVFREVRRALRPDGTLWLNLGDSYASKARGSDEGWDKSRLTNPGRVQKAQSASLRGNGERHRGKSAGLKNKDLVGMPWRVAFALQADGWWLRSDIIWAKPNPMPESVTDRVTKSHEYLFLLTKSASYYFDADAIREPVQPSSIARVSQNGGHPKFDSARKRREAGHGGREVMDPAQLVPEGGRNARSVWTIATRPYAGAHFAAFPPELPRRCILAGSAAKACGECGAPWERVVERTRERISDSPRYSGNGDRNDSEDGRTTTTTGWQPTCAHSDGSSSSIVLDPFAGTGTTGAEAVKLGRRFVGIDISREYLVEHASKRTTDIQMEAAL